jgi:formylglycine-generating enzyme required for sulfatase activity
MKGTEPGPLAFLPDGRHAVVGHGESVRLWRLPEPPAPTLTNTIGMKLASIPAGEFTMGSSEDRQGDEDLRPQHKVKITKPFYLGVYEVKQSEYEKVMAKNPSSFKDSPDQPVDSVTWEEATEFCKKLSELPEEKQAGRTYRLPTEAEWEYACRAGTQTVFHYGNSLSSSQANFIGHDPWGGAPHGPHLGKTVKVGSYLPNAWGLYDMHGNVWEWCLDGPRLYTMDAQADPRGPDKGDKRVVRGGSWNTGGWTCRAAQRIAVAPSYRLNTIGFRVVCESDPEGAWIRSVQALPAEAQVQAVADKFKELNPGFDGRVNHTIEGDAVIGLRFSTDQVAILPPLRALPKLKWLDCRGQTAGSGRLADLSQLRGLQLEELLLDSNRSLSDISPLQGMPLKRLGLGYTAVEELAPLQGMPLTSLSLWAAKVKDLSPLKGMRLESLHAGYCGIRDLSPLEGMPLRDLLLADNPISDLTPLAKLPLQRLGIAGKTEITDLSPIKSLKLRSIFIKFQAQRDEAVLRSMNTLAEINGKSPKLFWKEWEWLKSARFGPNVTWHIAGPFAISPAKDVIGVAQFSGNPDFTRKYPGASGGEVGWREVTADGDGQINLNALFSGATNQWSCYAYASVNFEKDGLVEIGVLADDDIVIWVNGQKVQEFQAIHNKGLQRFRASVKKGANAIVVRVDNSGGGEWYFTLGIGSAEATLTDR